MVNFFGRRGVGGGGQRLVLLFTHFLLGFQEDWTISCSMVCVSLVIHVVQRSILALASASPSVRVAASGVVIIFSCIKSYVSVFLLQRLKNFLPVFRRPTSIQVNVVDMLVCIIETHCAFSTLTVLGGY
jgi:hypothetical protein